MLQRIFFVFWQVKFNVIRADGGKGSKMARNLLIECEGLARVNEDVVPPEDNFTRAETVI